MNRSIVRSQRRLTSCPGCREFVHPAAIKPAFRGSAIVAPETALENRDCSCSRPRKNVPNRECPASTKTSGLKHGRLATPANCRGSLASILYSADRRAGTCTAMTRYVSVRASTRCLDDRHHTYRSSRQSARCRGNSAILNFRLSLFDLPSRVAGPFAPSGSLALSDSQSGRQMPHPVLARSRPGGLS